MKNALCFILFFWGTAARVEAQQKPHYTQYVLNNYILNPALSGIENYTDVKISYRNQWAGLQDAPVTEYLTVHMPIGKKDEKQTATSFAKSGVNLRGKQYWDDYEASQPHHGVGLQIVNDRTGPFSRFSAMATYAYHIGLTPTMNLAAGFGIGLNRVTLNTSKLDFGPSNPVDPAVASSGELAKNKLDASAGLWLYSSRFFVGASALQLVPQKIDYSRDVITLQNSKLVPHLFFSGGYRFFLNDDVSALPSVMVKYVQPVPVQAETNIKLQYKDLFWLGASCRFKYGFAGMVGINVLNSFNVSYSYDYTTTTLNTVSNGTHELMLGFTIGNKYSTESCPKRIW